MSQVLTYINEGKRHFTHLKRRKAFEMTACAVCGGRSRETFQFRALHLKARTRVKRKKPLARLRLIRWVMRGACVAALIEHCRPSLRRRRGVVIDLLLYSGRK